MGPIAVLSGLGAPSMMGKAIDEALSVVHVAPPGTVALPRAVSRTDDLHDAIRTLSARSNPLDSQTRSVKSLQTISWS